MVDAIENEIELRKEYLNEKIETIYFGGGTPSLLSTKQLDRLLSKTYQSFDVIDAPEITIEANPEDLTTEKSDLLRKSGYNRISVGVQTFDDKILTFLNRNHDGQMARTAIQRLDQASFENINLDLIYGIPGQPMAQWNKNLDVVIDIRPNHISSYALTIEPKTAFGNWQQKGKMDLVNDDDAASQFEVMVEKLLKAGYIQYEVSNFALPGFESKHNSSYWQQVSYLGVGPGAHSFNGHSRQFNISNNAEYIRRLKNGDSFFQSETLSDKERLSEYLFTGLRTQFGIDLALIKEQFQYDVLAQHSELIDRLIGNKQAVLLKDILTLTSAGFLIADSIVVELMPDEE